MDAANSSTFDDAVVPRDQIPTVIDCIAHDFIAVGRIGQDCADQRDGSCGIVLRVEVVNGTAAFYRNASPAAESSCIRGECTLDQRHVSISIEDCTARGCPLPSVAKVAASAAIPAECLITKQRAVDDCERTRVIEDGTSQSRATAAGTTESSR